jgi:hypothetical protein
MTRFISIIDDYFINWTKQDCMILQNHYTIVVIQCLSLIPNFLDTESKCNVFVRTNMIPCCVVIVLLGFKVQCQFWIQSSRGSWWPWWRQQDILSGNRLTNRMTQCRPQWNDRRSPGIRVGLHCHPATHTDSMLRSSNCYLRSDLLCVRLHSGFIQKLKERSRHCVEMLQADPRGTSGLCEVEAE